MVGDSLTSDMKGGEDYGIDTCWYNPSLKENGQMLTRLMKWRVCYKF